MKIMLIKPQLLVDNQAAISLIKNNMTQRRSRHIDIKYFFVRNEFQNNLFDISRVSSNNQLADISTGTLSVTQLANLRTACCIEQQE